MSQGFHEIEFSKMWHVVPVTTMNFEECKDCGFKCEKVCPVARATGKFYITDFLQKYLLEQKSVSWPCTGCHSCDEVCPAEFSPRQLIQQSHQGYLRKRENILSDYYTEYLEYRRIGVSRIDSDSLEKLRVKNRLEERFRDWDTIVFYPGCLISAQYPGIALKIVELLMALGVDQDKIVIHDELCCGSFLPHVSDEEFKNNGAYLFDELVKDDKRTLLVTACGSCTNTLRVTRERLVNSDKINSTGKLDDHNLKIMHYLDIFFSDDNFDALLSLMEPKGAGGKCYIQYPCQAETDITKRKMKKKKIREFLERLGYIVPNMKSDLGCCGASMLETHPDFALEFGIKRILNISKNGGSRVDDILIGCGNCYRIYNDFKPSMEVMADYMEDIEPNVQFLVDILIQNLG